MSSMPRCAASRSRSGASVGRLRKRACASTSARSAMTLGGRQAVELGLVGRDEDERGVGFHEGPPDARLGLAFERRPDRRQQGGVAGLEHRLRRLEPLSRIGREQRQAAHGPLDRAADLVVDADGLQAGRRARDRLPGCDLAERLGFFLDEELPFGRVEQPAVGESLDDLGGAGIAALRHLGDGGLGLGVAVGGKTREGLLETRGAGRTGRNEHQGKRREKSGRTRRQIPHGMFRVALKGNGWESASPTRRFQAPWASCPARRTSSSWCCSCRTSASPSRRQGPSSRRAPSTRRRPARALPSSRPRRTGRRP